ncbi:MAG: hypothetical protein IJD14_00355 [Christensenellaceae bacterium]|nr:hypothetical protein [Christensenellaceae bacterium]
MKNKKTWDLIGTVLGIVIIIVGIIFISFPPETYTTSSTDDASFGGDFYTYQYEATQAAASNAAVTANNLREMGKAQAGYFGFLFVAVGALTVVNYGKKFFTDYIVKNSEKTE